MKITFFNANPPHTIIAPDAFKKAIGQKVPIKIPATGAVGEGTLLDVEIVDGGINVTYETDMNLGVVINFPMKVEKVNARQMFPYMARIAIENEFKYCDEMNLALELIDRMLAGAEDKDNEIVRLKTLVHDQEQRWDDHFCLDGHVCE